MSPSSATERAPAISFGEIAGAIAHSIRNPLAVATASVERLALRHDRATSEGEACALAAAALRRIALRIDDLVEFALPPRAVAHAVDLAAWARSQRARWSARLGAGDRSLGLALDPAPLPAIADPALLARAVDRLLDNAVDASSPGDEIAIEIRGRGSRVEIAVVDPGRHSNADLARAGSPFCPSRGQGLGLGIPLTRATLAGFGGVFALERGPSGVRAIVALRAASAEEGAS